jgi:ribosomal protein S18 acetylase RimI-like enzyme
MITELYIASEKVAEEILAVQIPSYSKEAELIGYDEIPPLMDTTGSLMVCGETFYGYLVEGKVAGAISYKREGNVVDIHRLIVHPDHFRQGIGQSLLQYVERVEAGAAKFVVATGTRNEPAKRLYLKNGFLAVREHEAAPGLYLTFYEKKASR